MLIELVLQYSNLGFALIRIVPYITSYVSFINLTSNKDFFWKPKGADRKLKTDREKMDKKVPEDRAKYQLSYENTVLKEVRPHYITQQICEDLCLLI